MMLLLAIAILDEHVRARLSGIVDVEITMGGGVRDFERAIFSVMSAQAATGRVIARDAMDTHQSALCARQQEDQPMLRTPCQLRCLPSEAARIGHPDPKPAVA